MSKPQKNITQAAADQKNPAINIAQARAMRFFDTDEELTLYRHLLLISIVMFFIIFIVWSCLAELEEVTRGDGRIIPSSELQALQSIEPAIVEEFLVKEGEDVHQGQVLIRLQDIEASSDLGANRTRYLGLMATISRLQAEADGKREIEFPNEVQADAPASVDEEVKVFEANRRQREGQIKILSEQLQQREQELAELNSRIKDLRGVISLQEKEKDMIEPLVAKGAAPKLELLQLERGLKERTTELNALLASEPRTKSAIEESKAKLEDYASTVKAEAQDELSKKLQEMKEIREHLTALTERKTRKELKSPVDGTVHQITVKTVGGVVKGGDDLIKIVPKNDQLIVEAHIKPSDRAFIFPGQKAIIKITAYDFSIYGGLKGELLDISADTLKDERGQVYYRVRLKTYEKTLKHKGKDLPIVPGMITSVDILTGKKTVMQYLLKPFIKTLDEAMNER